MVEATAALTTTTTIESIAGTEAASAVEAEVETGVRAAVGGQDGETGVEVEATAGVEESSAVQVAAEM